MELKENLIVAIKNDYDATLEKASELKGLIISDFSDKAQYELVKSKSKEVAKIRIAIENKRKDLKAESLEFGRNIDKVAAELTLPISEIEKHLADQVKAVDNYEQQEKERKAKELNDKINAVRERFLNLGASYNPSNNIISFGAWNILYSITLAQLSESEIITNENQIKLIKAQNEADRLELEKLRALQPKPVEFVPPVFDEIVDEVFEAHTKIVKPVLLANFERTYLIQFKSKIYETDFNRLLNEFCKNQPITWERK